MKRFQDLIVLIAIVSIVGCQSGSPDTPKLDSTLARSSEAARLAYAEGDVEAAIAEYRDAIHRAWMMDDPYEAGTNAYNLAACLITIGDDERAQDWLIDARAELKRAGTSVAYTWLLQAKIAQDQGHWTEALSLIDRADCSPPPCDTLDAGCSCGGNDPCADRCVYQIPCVGDKFRKKNKITQCEEDFRAQVHLARARVAAELGDIPTALCYYAKACEAAKEVCSEDLQAELQNVAAMIHLAKGEYLQAAWHFDKEAKYSRRAKNYRVISGALELAAAAYSESGQYQLAADRLSRVARIWFGRGDMTRAWKHLNHASELVDRTGCDATTIRLSLLADEIQQMVGGDDPPEESLTGESLADDSLAGDVDREGML